VIQTGSSVFRPRARLMRLLGEELISDEVMAVSELVKNAYDADASTVTIRVLDSGTPELARVEIVDDGTGMSLQTLLEAWLEPATSFKRQNGRKRKTELGRYPLGEKGVGRFAADKLGAELELVSRTRGSDEEVRLVVSWEDFGDGHYLDEVHNTWEVRDPIEFPDGAHGTLIRVCRLRTAWDQALVERVHEGLARLISPGSDLGGFRMHLDCPDFRDLSGPVEDRFLETAPYRLVGHVNDRGELVVYHRSVPTRDLRLLAGDHFRLKRGLRTPQCGPFRLSLSVWDLDALGVNGQRLTRPVRALLRRMSGVSVYRDGFRVAPYGGPGDDWLELNQRRVNNPTMRISTNQIVGVIAITQEDNPLLRDRTSREGLVDTPGFRDLKALAVAALSILEEERYALRKAAGPPPPPPGSDPVLAHLENARLAGGGTKAILDAAAVYRKYREESERREEILLRLASAGAAAQCLLGQLNGSIASLLGLMPLIERRLEGASQLSRLGRTLGVVSQQLEALERLRAGQSAPVTRFDLRSLAQDALSIYAPAVSTVSVQAAVSGRSGVTVTGDRPLVLQALLHVLENAIIAAAEQQGDRWVEIGLPENPLRLEVRDSGSGVAAEFRDHIFDPYFTTRNGRNGVGLYFARALLRGRGHDLRLGESGNTFELIFEPN
jgi:signal transduction histidine kinase